MHDDDQPLLLSEAARILLLSERGVRMLETRGVLHPERTPGGLRIFRRAEVERVAAERQKARG